jgi:predicted phage replisome organizer
MIKSKRIYWFELDGDFFNSKIVKKMRKESNGDTLALIYLKILQSTTKTEGIVSFEGIEPLLEDELALLIDEDAKHIAELLEILDMYDRVERLGTNKFLLKEAENYIFSESESTRRVRKHRKVKNENVTGETKDITSVTSESHTCNVKSLHCNSKSTENATDETKDITSITSESYNVTPNITDKNTNFNKETTIKYPPKDMIEVEVEK